MRQPNDQKGKDSKAVETSPLRAKQRDARFLNFIESWVRRFNSDRHSQILIGSDFVIDFENLGLHPLTLRGREFIDYVRNRYKP